MGTEPIRLGIVGLGAMGRRLLEVGLGHPRYAVTHAADLPKVPVDIAGTGPRVIAMAARHAEGLTLGVGANPERIAAKPSRNASGIARACGARLEP